MRESRAHSVGFAIVLSSGELSVYYASSFPSLASVVTSSVGSSPVLLSGSVVAYGATGAVTIPTSGIMDSSATISMPIFRYFFATTRSWELENGFRHLFIFSYPISPGL